MRLLPRAPLASIIGGPHPLVGSRTGAVPQRLRVVCAEVDNVTFADALDAIFAPAREDRARFVHFAHAHLLNLAYGDEELRTLLARADLTLPDGVGVRLAARMRRVVLRENVNGTDLFPLLCTRASEEGVPLVLIGARVGVAEACVSRMQRELPDLAVSFASHGYLDEAQSRVIGDRVRALGRVIVLVGMGSPRQERWAWRHLVHAREATVLTVGGLFDMYSGLIPRAPVPWREAGFEWAWRLAMEPRRMAARYLVGNPLFLARALASALTAP